MPLGDKNDIVQGLRGRYGLLLAHVSADDLYAAYRAWIAANKPRPLLDWLRETFDLDAA